jgi:hypothetical protein
MLTQRLRNPGLVLGFIILLFIVSSERESVTAVDITEVCANKRSMKRES